MGDTTDRTTPAARSQGVRNPYRALVVVAAVSSVDGLIASLFACSRWRGMAWVGRATRVHGSYRGGRPEICPEFVIQIKLTLKWLLDGCGIFDHACGAGALPETVCGLFNIQSSRSRELSWIRVILTAGIEGVEGAIAGIQAPDVGEYGECTRTTTSREDGQVFEEAMSPSSVVWVKG